MALTAASRNEGYVPEWISKLFFATALIDNDTSKQTYALMNDGLRIDPYLRMKGPA